MATPPPPNDFDEFERVNIDLGEQQRLYEEQQRKHLHAVRELEQRLKDGGVVNRTFSIRNVTVRGNEVTKLDVIYEALLPAVQASTVGAVLEELSHAQNNLACMGIFQSIDIFLDLANPEQTDVVITLDEKNRIAAHTGTMVGVNDGNLVASLVLRNAFGRGEKVEFDWSYGTTVTSFYQFKYTKPRLSEYGRFWSFGVARDTTVFENLCSFHEKSNRAEITHHMPTKYFDHTLSYLVDWREVCGIPDEASFDVRLNAGHSLKSSVVHRAVMDRRDDTIFPTQGYAVDVRQELAGIGGDVAFLRHELNTMIAETFARKWTATALFSAGHVAPLTSSPTGVRINDRFFLGGPMNLRGFHAYGVGPRAQRIGDASSKSDALGGDAYWKGWVGLYRRLHDKWGIYAMGFANAGNLFNIAPSVGAAQPSNLSKDLLENTRVSVGAGLAFRTAVGLIEVTYSVPLRWKAGDRPRRGLQFGISLGFM